MTRTETLTNEKAGIIQQNCEKHDCVIMETGIVGKNQVRISVVGTEENLTMLFALVN